MRMIQRERKREKEEGQLKERTVVNMADPDDNEAEATGLQQYSGETTSD